MYHDPVHIKNVNIRIPGLRKTYRFLQISDAHVLRFDETEPAPRAAYLTSRVKDFASGGIRSDDRLLAVWQYIAAHSDPGGPEALDGVLLTGDILDVPSKLNLEFLGERLAELKIPYVHALGNHDWSYHNDYQTPHAIIAHRPAFSAWCGGNTFIHKKRIGELAFIAVDNSQDFYEDGVAETLEELLRGEEHVFLLQHVPFCVPTLHEDTVAKGGVNRDINIGEGGICINDNWKTVQRLILHEDSPVRAVLTGHLHFWHEDLLEGRLPQYVAPGAYAGNVVLYTVEGE